LLGTLLKNGQPKNIANCQNKGYSGIRLTSLVRYLICVDFSFSFVVRNYFIKSVCCPQIRGKIQNVFIRYRINQYIHAYIKIVVKYRCNISNIYGLYSTYIAVRKTQLLSQYTGLRISPPVCYHVTGCLPPAANESKTCSSTGGKQQQQPARGRAGAVYTAFFLTSSVISVRCADIWFRSLLGLENFGRILVVSIRIVLVLYTQTDIILADLTIKVSLIYLSGTSSYGLRFYVHQLVFSCGVLPLKNIRKKSLQCIEIISVSNRVITMSELPSPRDESSHGKSRQNVWRIHTHFHLLCPNVFAISWIYQNIIACNYQYSSDYFFICQDMYRYVYMLRVLTLRNKRLTMNFEFYASYLYICLSHPYIPLKNSSVYVSLYLFSKCNSSRLYGE
jgi:hypothetical protein